MHTDGQRVSDVQQRLLEWYAAQARDLPWRRSRDPYAILVAEVMLQQTQVDRVIPKWHAWLDRFPTLEVLAAASRADAIRQWQGLGYNLRAVRLHDIACQVMTEYGGRLPTDVAGLLSLKGVGRYTAGAVACFAYEQPVAMVDTNVRRVLSRVFGVAPAEVEPVADQVVPAQHAYPWNQALMDLGATLCRARGPLCLACPLVGVCQGPTWPVPSRAASPAVEKFHGSRRYYRGRLVEALRSLPHGQAMALADLVAAVAAPDDALRVADLARQLAKDGLLALDATDHVRLAD
ncbi:MAG TPA: A/G-specific adenine glycosylase [Chloroflexota bacterium]